MDVWGWCAFSDKVTVCDWCSCWKNVYSAIPEPYLNNGTYTYPAPWSGNIADLSVVTSHDCASESNYINGD